MATIVQGKSEWVQGLDGPWSISFDSPTSVGNLLLMWVYQSTENVGPLGAASCAGWNTVGHRSSPSDWRGNSTVLQRNASGETTVAGVTAGAPETYGAVISVVEIAGADAASVVATFADWDGSYSFTDQLANTIHALGVNGTGIAGSLPDGDTLISEDWNTPAYRGGGWALSGGTTTGSVAGGNGSLVSISFADETISHEEGPPVEFTTVGSPLNFTVSAPLNGHVHTAGNAGLFTGGSYTDSAGAETLTVAVDGGAASDASVGLNGGVLNLTSFDSTLNTPGLHTVTYVLSDGVTSETITRSITVAAAPSPTAVDDSVSTGINTPIDIDVLANDIDLFLPASLSVTVAPANGSAVVVP